MADFETDRTIVPILKYLQNGPVQKDPMATGFFYTDAGELYLVTNKHVIYKKDDDGHLTNELMVDELRILLPQSQITYGRETWDRLPFTTYDHWQKHGNPEVDIIVMPLGKDFEANNGILAIENIFLPKTPPVPGSEIFTLGYPSASTPVLATGKITDKCQHEPESPFRTIADMSTFPGMSGSPVFNSSGKVLVGVHSGRHNHPGTMTNKTNILIDQGAIVWSAQVLAQIIAQGGN